MTDLETKIEQDLKKAIETRRQDRFADTPEVALKVREVAESKDCRLWT